MATSGQTLNDRINAARYALAGQGLARCVCKATTEEVIGPKKKHLDYLLACTHEPNVSIPQLANLLIERTNHIYWVVVFKALVTVHHLMSYGNERFIQYLASSNYSFELSTFLDKTAARDFSMSTFIRRYSRYINEKALSYRLLAFDFCKVKRGNEGVLRIMPIDRLLKTLPILQNQLDALLEFDCTASDLNNGVINACFMLLFRDLIGLFACHNDGIINLLNKYFTLNKKMCREAFDLYKKFLVRMDKVSDFLRVAEVVGIDKDEIPDLRRAPSSLIDALEQHLQNIESNKKILRQQQSNSGKSGGDFSTLGSLTPPQASSSGRPSSPGSASATGATGSSSANRTGGSEHIIDELPITFKDDEVRKALEEEARVLSQYGSNEGLKTKSASSRSSTSAGARDGSPKFAVETTPKSIDDLFGDSDTFASATTSSAATTNNSNGISHVGAGTGVAALAFDNLSNNSSSLSTTAKNRPDLDSIKSAIKSATTTLEKVNNNDVKSGGKKASDDLLSLMNSTDPVSSFAGSSPFDLPSNGVSLKSGNPFPEAVSAWPSSSAQPPSSTNNNSVFKSQTQSTSANYTNLGTLDGFGYLLPMSATGSGSNTSNSAVTTTQSNYLNSRGASNLLGMSSSGLFKGDLDSTLANLAQNLTFDGINKTKK